MPTHRTDTQLYVNGGVNISMFSQKRTMQHMPDSLSYKHKTIKQTDDHTKLDSRGAGKQPVFKMSIELHKTTRSIQNHIKSFTKTADSIKTV
jgi:hypothetical protein